MQTLHLAVIVIISLIAGYYILFKTGFLSLDQEDRVLLNVQDRIPVSFGEQRNQIVRDIRAYNELFKGTVYRNKKNFAGARNLLKSLWSAAKHMSQDDAVDFRQALYDYNFSLELLMASQGNYPALEARIKKSEALRNKIHGYLDKLQIPL